MLTAAKAVEGAVEVPLFSYALFQATWVGTSIAPAHFVSLALLQETGRKDKRMKLKVRYESEFQTIELDANAMNEMWVSLSLEGVENLTEEEKETMIQEAFEEQFNKPEYNSWHKFDRHRGNLKRPFRKDDEDADESDGIDMVADNSQEEDRSRQYEYEALCQKIRAVLKPEFAEVIIAVCLDDMTPEEYAASTGEKRDTVYKRLQRAKKKFKEFL